MIKNCIAIKTLIIILLFHFGIQSTCANEIISEKEILHKTIDSCYKDLIKLDQNKVDLMMQMSLRVNEFTELENLFKNKNLNAEQSHVLMNKNLISNNLDSSYFYFREVESLYLQNNDSYSLLTNRLNAQFIVWCFANNYTSLGTATLKSYINYKNKDEKGISNPYWIYSVLMISYGSQNRIDQIIAAGESILKMTDENAWSNLYKTVASFEITACYLILGKPEEALKYCELANIYIKEVNDSLLKDPSASVTFNLAKINYQTYKAACYSYLKDFSKAITALEEQDLLISNKKNNYIVGPIDGLKAVSASSNWAYMIYYYEKGNYLKANDYLSKNMNLNLPEELYPDYYNLLKWDALIKEKLGDNEGANKALQEQIRFKDSLYNTNLTKEINSTWAMFEVERAQQEKIKSELKTDRLVIICISISTLGIASLILIFYFITTNKKLKEKNQILFLQQKNTISSADTYAIVIKDNNNENNSYDLYVRISDYLRNTKEFTHISISRESVAKALGTNRQYIIDAITENANMTFNEYINNLRLDYARNILANKSNILIKTIFREAGFSNRNTFSQLFKDRYGLSPSEFRDCAKSELNNKTEID